MTDRTLSSENRVRHFFRVLWLSVLYFPFWRSVNGIRRAAIAMRGRVNLVTDEELMRITETLDEHPEDWDHPCMCATCRSYADG
jgi:hypothetical protein